MMHQDAATVAISDLRNVGLLEKVDFRSYDMQNLPKSFTLNNWIPHSESKPYAKYSECNEDAE